MGDRRVARRTWERRHAAAMRRLKRRYPGEYDVLYRLERPLAKDLYQARQRALRALKTDKRRELFLIMESLELEETLPKGVKSEPGETRWSPNGYHYTRTETEWRLTHHIIAEEHLGRPLSPNEMVLFIGAKTDLRWENLRVVQKGTTSARRKLAKIEADIAELEAQREILRRELGLSGS